MKKLCQLSYKKKENLLLAFKLSESAKFICEKCGRVASDESALCNAIKPKKLKKADKEKGKGKETSEVASLPIH